MVAAARPRLADGEAPHVGIGGGMADEHADPVAVPVLLPAEQVESRLEADDMAVELRRQRAAAADLRPCPEGAAPHRGKGTRPDKQVLVAAPLMERAEGFQPDEAGSTRQGRVDDRLRPEEGARLRRRSRRWAGGSGWSVPVPEQGSADWDRESAAAAADRDQGPDRDPGQDRDRDPDRGSGPKALRR